MMPMKEKKMRSCFFLGSSGSISLILLYQTILSVVLFTTNAALPVQSASNYSNEAVSISSLDGNNTEAANGKPIVTNAPPLQLVAVPSLQPSSIQPSDIPSLQPSPERLSMNTTTEVNAAFGTNRCGECKINIDSINIEKAKIASRQIRDTFLLDYAAALKQMNCPTFNSNTGCTEETKAQKLALQEYRWHTNKILGSLDTFDCIVSENQPEHQSCPVQVFDQQAINVTDIIQDYEFGAGYGLTADDMLFDETRELTRVVLSAQKSLDAVDELINSLSEFGGTSACVECSTAASIAQREFSATKLQLMTELNGAHYILTEKDSNNDVKSKKLLKHNYIVTKAALGKILLVHKKVCKLEKEVEHLSKLVCPFGKTGLKSKVQRQGCDGVDQNCDGKVDECAEDQVPPTIMLAQPVPKTPFADLKSAREFLERNINVMDDCAAEIDTEIVLLDDKFCSSCKFSVMASDKRCDGVFHATGIYHDSAYNKAEFVLPVVSKKNGPISIKCGFSKPKDKKHIKDGTFDSCKEHIAPFKKTHGDDLHIDEAVFQRKVDVGLWYDIDSFKKDGIIDVDIVVKSNELEGQPNDNTMVSFAVRSPKIKGNAEAMVFLAPTTCQDGISTLSPCVAEETKGVTTRIYDIEITGTGADGATDTATCSVIVVPKNHHIPIKVIAAGTILVVGGVVAAEVIGEELGSGIDSKKGSKKKNSGKSKKRRAVRQRVLQGEYVHRPTVTVELPDEYWSPPTNAPLARFRPTRGEASTGSSITAVPSGSPVTAVPSTSPITAIPSGSPITAPTGSPITATPTGSPTLDPEVVLQKFEDDKNELSKQHKLSKWRFEVGSVSLKFDPKFDTVLSKEVHEEERRHLQEYVSAQGLPDYNPLC